jgi:ferritin
MKYFAYYTTKHVNSNLEHEKKILYYMPETSAKGVGNGGQICIPLDPNNMDYARMMEEVEAGTSTIEEVDDTPE